MRILIVPDIHDDLGFLRSIISNEDLDSFEHVVMLGDYFDPYPDLMSDDDNLRELAGTLLNLKELLGGRLHMLCGNHDLPYYALRPACGGNTGRPNAVIGQWLGSTTQKRAEIINAIWSEPFWRELKGAVLLDGWLFSHAGIHPEWWPMGVSDPLAAYEQFNQRWRYAMDLIFLESMDPIFSAGIVREGKAAYGGPLWLDWDYEFEDALPLPQVVGHTRNPSQRQRGRSFCIDFGQSAYAIADNGELQINAVTALLNE